MFDYNLLVNYMISGLFVGIGSTVGNWLITRGLIKRIEKIEFKGGENKYGKKS